MFTAHNMVLTTINTLMNSSCRLYVYTIHVRPTLQTLSFLPYSPVFCDGPLLASVQNASIFSDSKEFVDRPLLDSPANILAAFGNLSDPTNVTVLREFVEKWTLDAGSDLEMWDPPDWVAR